MEKEMLWPSVGVCVPQLLMPARHVEMEKYAVVACDQFTSEPAYWQEAERLTGGAPSALNMIFPEVYLSGGDGEARIDAINAAMDRYIQEGALAAEPAGMMLVKRRVSTGVRRGLVLAVDLEQYDFTPGNRKLIRATERTIVSRIPPRLAIRRRAAAEFSHVMLLVDDPKDLLFGALEGKKLPLCYDFDLMLGGGRVTGNWVRGEALAGVKNALETLLADAGEDGMLFAVGDGNHSLATAKALWEEVKKTLPEGARHPARYALAEVVNLHDPALVFEPIHRVTFGDEGLREKLAEKLASQGLERRDAPRGEGLWQAVKQAGGCAFGVAWAGGSQVWRLEKPESVLAVACLQKALDELQPEIDYIHGEKSTLELGTKAGNCAFLLPGMDKFDLFPAVEKDGALPRKTFSMGHAQEKRYYIEGRCIR